MSKRSQMSMREKPIFLLAFSCLSFRGGEKHTTRYNARVVNARDNPLPIATCHTVDEGFNDTESHMWMGI